MSSESVLVLEVSVSSSSSMMSKVTFLTRMYFGPNWCLAPLFFREMTNGKKPDEGVVEELVAASEAGPNWGGQHNFLPFGCWRGRLMRVTHLDRLESTTVFIFIWSVCRSRSLLESWGATFLLDWQPPLMFVWFRSIVLYVCSNSMVSAHVIFKWIRQKLRVTVTQEEKWHPTILRVICL